MASSGIRVRAKSNKADVLRALDAFGEDVIARAMPLAMNKLGDQARVAGVRKIAEVYGIGVRSFAPYLEVREAAPGRLEFVLVAKGKGLPLSLFKPRQTRLGVSVTLLGRRVLFPHSFLKAIRGNLQVWARGSYNATAGAPGTTGKRAGKRRKRGIRELTGRSGFLPTGETFGRFAFGRLRFPISVLRSTTPPAALTNEEVLDAMNERIREQAPSVIRNALRFASRS